MKIRTLDELSDHLRDDLAWRRKEMLAYDAVVKTSVGERKQAYLRGGYAVVYAHWEGFVKYAIDAYIDFVRIRGLNIGELNYGFLAMIMRPRIKHIARNESNSGATMTAELLQWLVEQWAKRSYLPASEKLSTQSNLLPKVLREMMETVGLPYGPEFQAAEKPVIAHLVETRNHLAHGGRKTINEDAFQQVHTKISGLMDRICESIENSAINQEYKRAIPDLS